MTQRRGFLKGLAAVAGAVAVTGEVAPAQPRRESELSLDIDTVDFNHTCFRACKALFLDGREIKFVTRWNKKEGWMDVYDKDEPTFALRFKRYYGTVTYVLRDAGAA